VGYARTNYWRLDLQEFREVARLSHRSLGQCLFTVFCCSSVLGLKDVLSGSEQENTASRCPSQDLSLLNCSRVVGKNIALHVGATEN
jgi:hypothetical protein